MNEKITMFKPSINYIFNYLKNLPSIWFNSNRDARCTSSGQYLKGFKEIVITGFGNCQFNAVSYALTGNETFSMDLRAIAFLTVTEKVQLFQTLENRHWLESETVSGLLKICCTPGEYGNMDTLFALSMTLERCFIIVQHQNKRKQFFKIQPPSFDSTTFPIVLHLSNPGRNDAHYNVLLPEDPNSVYEFPEIEVYNISTLMGE